MGNNNIIDGHQKDSNEQITDASDKMTPAHWLTHNQVVGQLVINASANTLPLRCNDISQNHDQKKKCWLGSDLLPLPMNNGFIKYVWKNLG